MTGSRLNLICNLRFFEYNEGVHLRQKESLMYLNELKAGERAVVRSVGGEGALR